jgi:hypothetical protein
VLIPIVLAPAGAAKPPSGGSFEICVQDATLPPAPSCGSGSASSFAGNTAGQQVQVTLFNAGTSAGSIGSANIALPPQLRIDTVAGAPEPSKYVSAGGSGQIQVRNVNIQPGKSFALTFYVDASCSGSDSWVSAARSGSGFTGTDFTPGSSTGTLTTLTEGCRLGFVTQPAATANGSPITDQAGSIGNAVEIGLFDNSDNPMMTSCPTGFSGCKVSIAQGPADGNRGGTWTGLPFATSGGPFVASFDGSLTVDNSQLPESFTLLATGDDGLAVENPSQASHAFDLALYAQQCGASGCSLSQRHLPNILPKSVESLASLTTVAGAFSFTTLSSFEFTNGVPLGCAGFTSLGVAGVAETDARTAPAGAMTISYYVNLKSVQAKYGKNVGQQLIPICAGAKPVNAEGVVHDCTPNTDGWADDLLDSSGAFTGQPGFAQCGEDGYYWGILGSFQDKIPAGNPSVTSWGSGTVSGTNYRRFDITIPENWDWRAGS